MSARCMWLTAIVSIYMSSLFGQARSTLDGTWIGALTGDVNVDMVFKFESKDGSTSCLLDIPTYNIVGLPADEIQMFDDSLRVGWRIGAAFRGTFTNTNEVSGTWFQPAGNLPLTIKRSETGYRRLQEPKPPTPYREEELVITSGDTRLGATLSVPNTPGPHKLVVMLSPSGPQNRDGNMHSHNPQLVVADRFTRAGIAVLRCDDRGIGSSEGTVNETTIALQAADAEAAIKAAREANLTEISSVGVMGFGEGGSAGMKLASEAAIDFLVLTGTPGVPYSDVLIGRSLSDLERNGASPEDIKRDTSYARSVYRLMAQAEGGQVDSNALRSLADGYFVASQLLRSRFPNKEQFYRSQMNMTSIPWFRSVTSFDPAKYIVGINCPTYALFGSVDTEFDPVKSADALKAGLEIAPVTNFQVEIVTGLNHLFQPSINGLPTEYSMAAVTFDETTMLRIAEWIKSL